MLIIDKNLPNHKKIIKLAELLNWTRRYAIGFMVDFWAWTRQELQSADISKFSEADLILMFDLPEDTKLTDAMLKAGLLDDKPLRVHDWQDYKPQMRVSSKRIKFEIDFASQIKEIKAKFGSSVYLADQYIGMLAKQNKSCHISESRIFGELQRLALMYSACSETIFKSSMSELISRGIGNLNYLKKIILARQSGNTYEQIKEDTNKKIEHFKRLENERLSIEEAQIKKQVNEKLYKKAAPINPLNSMLNSMLDTNKMPDSVKGKPVY